MSLFRNLIIMTCLQITTAMEMFNKNKIFGAQQNKVSHDALT